MRELERAGPSWARAPDSAMVTVRDDHSARDDLVLNEEEKFEINDISAPQTPSEISRFDNSRIAGIEKKTKVHHEPLPTESDIQTTIADLPSARQEGNDGKTFDEIRKEESAAPKLQLTLKGDWKDSRVKAFCCTLFTAILVIGLSIIVIQHTMKLNRYDHFDPVITIQVVEDWQKLPFVDITVQEEPCTGEQEPVFYREWGGTVEGCDVIEGETDSNEIMTKRRWEIV